MRSLLRSLLRAHRGLPGEMRKLGDKYVMKEFKDTRDVTKPEHLARSAPTFFLGHLI